MNLKVVITAISITLTSLPSSIAQTFKDGKLSFTEDGSKYLKISMLNQVWVRNIQNNPGSTYNGIEKANSFDIGIRRFRMQFYGSIAKRTFFYAQLGINNYNALSDRKAGFFLHDAVGEYEVLNRLLSIGSGLSGWSGLSRFSSSSVATIMGLDLPLYQEATNDVTDQFLRKLSVYAKGKINKLDYRIAISEPLAIQKSSYYIANPSAFTSLNSNSANFSIAAPAPQIHSYLQYQFLEEESNLLPYTTGSYLGNKKVFNIGIGQLYQAHAMNRLADNNIDTLKSALNLISIDAYYDAPLNKVKGTAISAYIALSKYDFGKNYIRMAAPMAPTNGNNNTTVLNGTGNGAPLYGTGSNLYAQIGYKLPNATSSIGTLMPYASIQYSNLEKLNTPMTYVDAGINLFLANQNAKLTIALQNRPVFILNNNEYQQSDRKNAIVFQFQTSF
jgi:hypothetical protein